MKPSTVVLSLGCLLFITSTSYIFYMPQALKGGNRDNNGYWGDPDAEFDWCEYNYYFQPYIAEIWNTLTGFTYIIMGIILYRYYYNLLTMKHHININNLLNLIIILIALGIGTCLYHATLRYKMQLLDEFPMYFLLCYGCTTMYVRCSNKSNLYNISLIFSSFMCCMLWFTKRSDFIHEIFRILMTVTFAIYFVYIFYVGAIVSSKCKDKECEIIFDQCYIIWILSIIFWFIENCFCSYIWWLPYINFHGTIWHLGAGLGIYYFFTMCLIFMLVQNYSFKIKIDRFLFIFPYIYSIKKKE